MGGFHALHDVYSCADTTSVWLKVFVCQFCCPCWSLSFPYHLQHLPLHTNCFAACFVNQTPGKSSATLLPKQPLHYLVLCKLRYRPSHLVANVLFTVTINPHLCWCIMLCGKYLDPSIHEFVSSLPSWICSYIDIICMTNTKVNWLSLQTWVT